MNLKNTHKILLYNKTWDMNENEEYNYPIIDNFELTTEHKYIDKAIAIIFHMPTLPQENKILKKCMKRNGQLWVFWSMECEVHYKWQYNSEIIDLFDIIATYKLDSDIPVPYIYRDYYELLRSKPMQKKGFVDAFISSNFDESNRFKSLKELMSYINVDSYGKVLNNKTLIKDKGEETKREIISQYKFTIAFENAIAKDYVTEKFFHPLIAGSVPIYLGAPNIDDFAPGDNCFINVNSFSSIKALANYLLELENNPEQYKQFLKWKTLPFRDEFNAKANIIKRDPLIRLCDQIKMRVSG